MFQLTKGEHEILKSQIATSNLSENQKGTNWTSQIATSNFAKMGLRKTPPLLFQQFLADFADGEWGDMKIGGVFAPFASNGSPDDGLTRFTIVFP